MKFITLLLTACPLLYISCASDNAEEMARKRQRRKAIQEATSDLNPVYDTANLDNRFLPTGWYYVMESPMGLKKKIDRSYEVAYIAQKPFLAANHFSAVGLYQDKNNGDDVYGISIQLDPPGRKLLSDATAPSAYGKKMALVINNHLLIAARIEGRITGGKMQIYLSNYTKPEVENLIAQVRM